MRFRARVVAAAVVGSALTSFAFSGSALAAFPDFSDCPRTAPGVDQCFALQSTGGSLRIKGIEIPLGDAIQIRGGVAGSTIVPPVGTEGLFSEPVTVPGGLVGNGSASPFNRLTVEFKAAGQIGIDLGTLQLTVPVKLKVKNPLLGSCRFGSDRSPIVLNLTTGTTNPPAPNAPITGAIGPLSFGDVSYSFDGNTNVDNAFAVPAASGCGALNSVFNWRFDAPSAAGRNTLVLDNNMAFTYGL